MERNVNFEWFQSISLGTTTWTNKANKSAPQQSFHHAPIDTKQLESPDEWVNECMNENPPPSPLRREGSSSHHHALKLLMMRFDLWLLLCFCYRGTWRSETSLRWCCFVCSSNNRSGRRENFHGLGEAEIDVIIYFSPRDEIVKINHTRLSEDKHTCSERLSVEGSDRFIFSFVIWIG